MLDRRPHLAQFDPEDLGRRFASQRRRLARVLFLAGLAAIVGGFAAFGVYGDRATALQKHGVHTRATVTSTVLYRHGAASFDEHIVVAFGTPSGRVRGVHIPIGENDAFHVGQKVDVAYDRADPRHVVFAHGYPDPGWIGAVFFFGILGGVGACIWAAKTSRLAKGARQALERMGRPLTVESRRLGRRWALVLDDGGGDRLPSVWLADGSTWPVGSVQAPVFGDTEPVSVVVVAEPLSGAVTAGRIRKRLLLR